MTSTYRGRWDDMSNPKHVKEYLIDTAATIEVGDLMWWDNVYRVARSFADARGWTGSTDGSQGQAAECFIGVAMSAHTANDTLNNTVRIAGKGVFGFTVTTAATFEVGDFVTASKDPSFSLLLDQAVDKSAVDASNEPTARGRELSIGRAAKRYGVATSVVEVEINGTKETGSARPLSS
jgi:hypothetical protein